MELLRAFIVAKEDVEAYRSGKPIAQMLSQRHLAEKANVHPSFINHWTSGRKKLSHPPTAERIADILGVLISVPLVPVAPTFKSQFANCKVSAAA